MTKGLQPAWCALALTPIVFVVSCATAELPISGETVTIEGEVVTSRSRWTHEQGSIITESTLVRPDGSTATVTQLGGVVDGVGMIASHHPSLLEVGRHVRARVVPSGDGTDHRYVLRQVMPDRDADGSPTLFGGEPGVARYGVNRTKQTGTPLFWANGCIHLTLQIDGSTHLPDQVEFNIIEQSTQEWQSETQICSGLTFSTGLSADPGVGRNRVNSVVFRENRWCRPATATADELCHDPNAIAVTQVFFVDDPNSPRDGTILEADMEFNGVEFAFSEGGDTLGVAPRTADLRATTTHELGHVLGLAHNCWTGFENRPMDHQGNPVPECSSSTLSPEITDATMYFQQEEGETKKASLESSDVLGVCAGLADLTCDRVVRGGCSAIGGQGPASSWLLLVLAMGAAALRRRRRALHV